jgi:hypothetical protein
MPKAPDIPPPPAQRQTMKSPEFKSAGIDDPMRRRRGFAALMSRASPSLNAPTTTSTLGG